MRTRIHPTSTVLALDPGLAHVGFILARIWRRFGSPLNVSIVDANTGDRLPFVGLHAPTNGPTWDIEVVEAGLWIAPLPDIDERVLDAIDDTTNRAMLQVCNVLAKYAHEDASVIVAEKISHPRDASTAIQVTAFWAMLTYACKQQAIPFVTLRPQDIRSTLGLSKTKATMTRNDKKKLVTDEIERRYGKAKLKTLLRHLTRKEDRSHPLDALASFTAAMIKQFGTDCTFQ